MKNVDKYEGAFVSDLLTKGKIERMLNNEYGNKLFGGTIEDNKKTAGTELPSDKVKITENKKIKNIKTKSKKNKSSIRSISENNKLKEYYSTLVESLIKNMIKLFLMEYVSLRDIKNVDRLRSLAENIFLMVKKDESVFLYESVMPKIQLLITDKVSNYQMLLNNLMENLNEKNIKLVLEYIKKTNKVIKEAEEFLGNDTANNIQYKANEPTLMQVVSLYGSILNILKDKIEHCNNASEDISQIASCQLVSFEEAISSLSNLIDSCGNNEDCKSKILKAIGRLQIIKSSVENVLNSSNV